MVIKTIIKEADNKLKPFKDDLDSDDSYDDDLPAHDMSSKDQAPIHYLREVLDLLSDPESDRHEDCPSLIPKLKTPPLSMTSRPTLSWSPFTILDFLQAGGSLLKEDVSAEPGEYLTMVVGGLGVGGGGAGTILFHRAQVYVFL